MNLYKHIAATTVLLSMSSYLLAENDQVSSQVAENDQDSSQVSSKSKRATMSQEEINSLVINHFLGDKMPLNNNPNRFVFQGSFIYWQADVDGIDYGLEQNATSQIVLSPVLSAAPVSNDLTDSIKQKNLDFKWDPGFKVGIGAVFGDRDEWDLFLNWTWLHTSANRNINFGIVPDFTGVPSFFSSGSSGALGNIVTGDYITPGFGAQLMGTPGFGANTRWRLQYNTVDLELGRNFLLGNILTMRPHIGFRGAFLHQHTKINYLLGSTVVFNDPLLPTSPFPGSSIGTAQFKGSNKYDSFGVRGGFDLRWNFTKHFCVYGDLAGSILYGKFDVDETFLGSGVITVLAMGVPTQGNTTGNSTFNQNFHRTRTNLEALIGLMWHTDFNNDKQHLFISAGYEVNEWFQQNELRSIQGFAPFFFSSTRTSGDLGLHGLTVDLRFDF